MQPTAFTTRHCSYAICRCAQECSFVVLNGSECWMFQSFNQSSGSISFNFSNVTRTKDARKPCLLGDEVPLLVRVDADQVVVQLLPHALHDSKRSPLRCAAACPPRMQATEVVNLRRPSCAQPRCVCSDFTKWHYLAECSFEKFPPSSTDVPCEIAGLRHKVLCCRWA